MSNPAALPSAASQPRMAGPRSRSQGLWLRLVVLGLLAALCGVPTLLFLIVVFGHLQGEEFAAESFDRREFEYYEIPLVRIQVTPIYRSPTTGSLESLLVRRGYLGTADPTEQAATSADPPRSATGGGGSHHNDNSENFDDTKDHNNTKDRGDTKGNVSDPGDDQRWDLVLARRGQTISARGDAQILCQYLDAKLASGVSLWQQWTEDHQDLAAVVWPLVARLARQRMYVLVPEVFDRAERGGDPELVRREICQSLAEAFRQLAVAQQQQGRHQVALELIADGLTYVPDDVQLLAARRESEAARGAAP